MSDSTYEQFFSDFGAFLSKEKWRKKLNNDYNPLLVIRSQSDEVRLHSRIIHSLLDTRGNHCVGALFLEPFLEMLGFRDFFVDLDKVFVRAEYKHIDLYISDGDRHIIIENKIYAGDGDKQIERYIDNIIRDGVDCENISVVYLSVNRREVADYSLGAWKISDDKKSLICGDKRIAYKNITYENEILSWVESCQIIAKNIANLNATLEFYKDCVTKITKGDKMALEQLLEQKPEYIAIASEIQRLRLEQISVETFKKNVATKAEFSDWQIFNEKDIAHFKTGGYKRVFAFGNKAHLNQTFKFMLTLEKTNFNAHIGFGLFVSGAIKGKAYNHFCGFNGDIVTIMLKEIVTKHGFIVNYWGWWLLDENDRYAVDLSNESLEEYFKKLYKKVNALNDLLKNDKEIQALANQVKIYCDNPK